MNAENIMLQIKGLTYRVGGRTILSNATSNIPTGHKVGLVGANGAGKTTLFRLIAKEIFPDNGHIQLTKNRRLGYITQDLKPTGNSLIETVISSDRELMALEKAAKNETDPNLIGELQTRLADIDAHTAEARAATILAGLGFDKEAQTKNQKEFSGGWQMRVALAGTLFARPDLLLLDEPTNHLDLEASVWLEDYLSSFPGTLLIISHDRDLLNRAVRHILYLEGKTLTMYAGGYDRFRKTLDERRSHDEALRAKQIKERRHMQSFVDRFRAKATKARQAQSRLKALARMEPIVSVAEKQAMEFFFPKPDALAPPLLTIEDVTVGYGGIPVLNNLNLQINTEDRIALLGTNGNGKSTLVKLIAGFLEPTDGKVQQLHRLNIGYFSQNQADAFDSNETPYKAMMHCMENSQETTIRAHLGRFGLGGNQADTPIGMLSGGEKSRLLLCRISLKNPHILLLDEPTNHLDIDARDALIQAVNSFTGAVVLVSHDPHTIKLIADQLWLVTKGKCIPFDGDIDDYRDTVLRNKSKAGPTVDPDKPPQSRKRGNTDQQVKRRERARVREETSHLRTCRNQCENRIDTLNRKIRTLEMNLARPETYEGSTAEMLALSKELSSARKDLEKEEMLWLETEEALSSSTIVSTTDAEDDS